MKWTGLLWRYPPRWRQRYGEEFTALLEQRQIFTRDVWDVLRSAADAHLTFHPARRRARLLAGLLFAIALWRTQSLPSVAQKSHSVPFNLRGTMTQYIMRRIVLLIPTYLMVLTMVFLLLRVTPGDAVDMLFTETVADPADKARIRAELGLDRPIYIQYVWWLGQLAQGDFGVSLHRNQRVSELLAEAIPVSFRLGVMSLIIAWCIAIPVGVLAAVKADSGLDQFARGFAVLMLAVPNFWIAIMVLTIPAFLIGWSPNVMYTPFTVDPMSNVTFFIVPALLLGTGATGTLLRLTRAMMLEVLRSDFIRTARAKGLNEGTVIIRHGLKNALIPVVTILGGQLANVIGGSTIIENVFAVPGMGRLLFTAIQGKDVQVVQTIIVIFAAFIMIMNLLVDISYAWLDPRVRYS